MSFISQYNVSQQIEFRQRVKIAIYKSAIAVMAETQTENKPDLNGKRASFGYQVLRNWTPQLEDAAATAVVTNAAISESSSDSDIEFTVNSMFNALAGVNGGEL